MELSSPQIKNFLIVQEGTGRAQETNKKIRSEKISYVFFKEFSRILG